MKKPFHIAIDGPVAAGKGTVSGLVAKRLGFLYVDTGAMYRVAAYLAIQHGVPLDDDTQIAELSKKARIEMRSPNEEEKDGRLSTVLLNGEDVSWKIRTQEVSQGSSRVAVLPTVRQVLVEKQRQIAATQNVVMEGRDITYRVLPKADLKIFLTGSEVVRAKRRMLELQIRGEDVSFDEVYKELLERDSRDSKRDNDPLHQVPDAVVIDSSDLSIEQVVEIIVGRVELLMQDESHE